ncbi:MAG: efflux transporter outer membrane subunit [Steroidobacteraceae bacterium]|jgi:multidrug efflux system outer membrane protein
MSSIRATALVAMSALAACAGLPSKQAPVVLSTSAPLSGLDDASGGTWPDKEWWKRYQDPTLDTLIEQSLAVAPSLATARARFDAARESVRVAGAASGAQVDLQGDAERQRLSDNGIVSAFPPALLPFHWYSTFDLGVAARYTFDWWGKQRATVEAAMDQAHAAQAERAAAALILASSVADTYYGWQADQNRLALARERLATVQREAQVSQERVNAELDPADSLHRTDTAIAAVKEQIAGLEGSAQLRIVALAALLGRPPADLPPLEAKSLPAVPVVLPDNVRLDLIARRADIIASRWRVEAAQKNLESARAEFYPDISVNVLANLDSLTLNRLLEYGSRAPEAGVALHLPLFDAGRLKARYRATQIVIDEAVAAYNQTLVDAAHEVATEAATRAEIAAQRAQRAIQVDAALQLRRSAAARVRQGILDSRTELGATETWIGERDSLLQLDSAALSADIGLQRALGGGYEMPANLTNNTSKLKQSQP